MTGVYSIIPRVRTPSINAGEPIEIEVFLTGYGNSVKDHKFQVSYSSPIFAKDHKGRVGFIEYCIKVAKEANGRITGILSGDAEWENPETHEIVKAVHHDTLDPVGTTLTLNEGYFMSIKEAKRVSGMEVDEKDPRMLGEMTHDGRPPILLKFNTLPNATKGDHDIFLTLFYTVSSDLKMDQKIVTIHINSWIEKHQKTLQRIAVILGLSALVAAIVQAIYTVLQFYK